jgi:hypothetical protein
VSCVKLPAAVAFPTDDRLLQRIEDSRRALPPNSMKPLWKSRGVELAAPQVSLRTQDGDARTKTGRDAAAALQAFPPRGARWTLPPTVHIEDVYARSRIAVGQH